MPLIPNDKELISADLTTAEFQKGLQKFVNSCKRLQGGSEPKKYILEKVGGEFTFTPEGYSCILYLPEGEKKAEISLINSSLIGYGFIAIKLASPEIEITIKHKNSLLKGHIVTLSNKDINLRADVYTVFELVEFAWVEQFGSLPVLTKEDSGKVLSVNEEGEISLKIINSYELCEFYYFRHPKLRDGFMPAYGGLIEKASKTCPEAFEYLQTEHGKFLCKTEEEWQALTKDTWATLADGTKVGWDGIGGAPYYVVDTKMDTLRLPDLRGMYVEAAGFDDLSVGGTHGDAIRSIRGEVWSDWNRIVGFNSIYSDNELFSAGSTEGISGRFVAQDGGRAGARLVFDASKRVPTSNKNQPRAWGALPCVYLGN